MDSRGTDEGEPRQRGWYENPADPGEERYWNGTKWTDSRPATGLRAALKAAEQSAAIDVRRKSGLYLLGAVITSVTASLVGLAAINNGGGFLWTGGFLLVVVLLFRSAITYRESIRRGLPGLTVGRWVAVVALFGVGVIALARFGMTYEDTVSDSHMPAPDGSIACWRPEGEMVEAVSCSDPDAVYETIATVSTWTDCPRGTQWWVEGDGAGEIFCLAFQGP